MSGSSSFRNFVKFSHYCFHVGDTNLQNLKSDSQNTCKTSTNNKLNLLIAANNLTLKKKKKNAANKESKYYFILASEATDCAMEEQMLLIIIFFGNNNMIREEFISFLECKNGSIGVGLYQTIRKFLGSKGFQKQGSEKVLYIGWSCCIV